MTSVLACAPSGAFCQTSTGVDLDGKPIDPFSVSRGKPVVLIFLRTDCPISNRYAPTLQRLSRQYADAAQFFLVYPDKSESAAAIKHHLAEYSYQLPALRDPSHSLVKRAQATITPEMAVFDSHGALAYHGRIDNWYVAFGQARPAPTTHEFEDAMQAVRSGKRPAIAATDAVGCYISDLQ